MFNLLNGIYLTSRRINQWAKVPSIVVRRGSSCLDNSSHYCFLTPSAYKCDPCTRMWQHAQYECLLFWSCCCQKLGLRASSKPVWIWPCETCRIVKLPLSDLINFTCDSLSRESLFAAGSLVRLYHIHIHNFLHCPVAQLGPIWFAL